MCNACGFACCAFDGFSECGCDCMVSAACLNADQSHALGFCVESCPEDCRGDGEGYDYDDDEHFAAEGEG